MSHRSDCRPNRPPPTESREDTPGNDPGPAAPAGPVDLSRADEDDSLSVLDDDPVDLRCSVVVVREGRILAVQRGRTDDWVLPGGRPRAGESMQSCARRETHEETGLHVQPMRCAFIAEVINPEDALRIVELIFVAEPLGRGTALELSGEPGNTPHWLALDELRRVHLQPPIAGYLPALVRGAEATGAYLGNLWRPGARTAAATE